MSKKSIVGAVLALAVVAFTARPAAADIKWNGTVLNGLSIQGISLNGISLNGLRTNGLSIQGVKLNGIQFNGPGLVLQGVRLNGLSIQGIRLNGVRLNGALLQGDERPAGPQCTAAGVDFSAVPLAKVNVRLPQAVR